MTTREFTVTIEVFGNKQKVRVEARSMAEAIEKVQAYKRKLEAQIKRDPEVERSIRGQADKFDRKKQLA